MMLEDHTKPPDLKSKTLEEIHRERMAYRPDQWTLAWWKAKLDEITKAYLGLCHMVNTVVASLRDGRERLDAYETRITAIEAKHSELEAKIGELQAENTSLLKRVDDMAEWGKKMEKRVSKPNGTTTTG